jgi:sortase A
MALLATWAIAFGERGLYQAFQKLRLDHALQLTGKAGSQGPTRSGGMQVRSASSSRSSARTSGMIGRIDVPRLGVSAIIGEGVDTHTLNRAVGHLPGTAFPGEAGNVVVAGHRDSFFRELRNIHRNDTLRIVTLDGAFNYRVDSTGIVPPDRVDLLDPTPLRTVTLVTCYPFNFIGNAPLRFIVRARQVGGKEAASPG